MPLFLKLVITLLCVSIALIFSAALLTAFGLVALGNIFGWTGVSILCAVGVTVVIYMAIDVWRD